MSHVIVQSLTRLGSSRRTHGLFFLLGLIVLSTPGCTSLSDYVNNGFKVGPSYQKPAAPVANEWIDSKTKKVNGSTSDLTSWWTVFQDPTLNSLVEDAYRQNLSLRSAGTRILAARAQRNIAAGNLFPQGQEAFADISRNALSGNTANPVPVRFFDNNAAGFNLSWELDFWGRFRRGVEAADRELDASVENYDDALVLLISEVASTYVEIRVFQQRLKYVAGNIKLQKGLVDDAEGRKGVGATPKLDIAQMRSNLSDTEALKEQLEIGMRFANNRLCVLLGVPVRDLISERLKDGPIPSAPPQVAVGMPADLLRRRPDLRRAERLVAAQSARVGIATANLYPRFTLVGAIGYEAENFSSLFSSKSLIGTIGPNLRWDILNYGRLVNGIRVQDALFQTAALDYQNLVLKAGREVEDGVVNFLQAQAQTQKMTTSAKEAEIAAIDAVTLSRTVKTFDLNRNFVTSNFLVKQQDKLAVAQGDIAFGLIQIYRALGGGWEIRLNEPAGNQQGEAIPAQAPRRRLLPGGARFGSVTPAPAILGGPADQNAALPATVNASRR